MVVLMVVAVEGCGWDDEGLHSRWLASWGLKLIELKGSSMEVFKNYFKNFENPLHDSFSVSAHNRRQDGSSPLTPLYSR